MKSKSSVAIDANEEGDTTETAKKKQKLCAIDDDYDKDNYDENMNEVKSKIDWRRFLLLVYSLTAVSCTSGLVYGWPALRRALQQVGGSELTEKELGRIFTAGSWTVQGGRFVFGFARDRLGTRLVACTSIACVAAGCLGIALSDSNNALALTISIIFVGCGAGCQLCFQPIADLFQQQAGIVMALLSGAFQMSGIVFLVINAITDNRSAGYGGIAAVTTIMMLVGVVVLPSSSSFVLKEKKYASNGNTTNLEESKSSSSSIATLSAKFQMCSLEYVALVVWFSVNVTPMQYYLGSIGFQLEQMGDNNGYYTGLFSIFYSCAVLVSPFTGAIADRYGVGVAQGLGSFLVCIAFFILSGKRSLTLKGHAVGLVCYGVGRFIVFFTYFTNLGVRFGYANFGTLAGFGLIVSAMASLVQYPLIAATVDGYDTAVNIGSGIVIAATMPYCIWLAVRERKLQQS